MVLDVFGLIVDVFVCWVNIDGMVMMIVGVGWGFGGDGGLVNEVFIVLFSSDIVYDVVGNLYLVDVGNCCVCVVDMNGIILIFVGIGVLVFIGDGGFVL